MASAQAVHELQKALADYIVGDGVATSNFEQEMIKLIINKLNILISKRKMRGTDNIQRQGLMGVVNRLSEDKLERVKRMVEDDYLARKLTSRGMAVGDLATLDGAEQALQLEDDLMDIANYCDIAIMLLRKSWE